MDMIKSYSDFMKISDSTGTWVQCPEDLTTPKRMRMFYKKNAGYLPSNWNERPLVKSNKAEDLIITKPEEGKKIPNLTSNFYSAQTGKQLTKEEVTKIMYKDLPAFAEVIRPSLQPWQLATLKKMAEQKQEKKDTTMRYDDIYSQTIPMPTVKASAVNVQAAAANPELIQRDYLLTRLEKLFREKKNDLRKPFNIDVENTPKTPSEIIKRIQEGKFKLPKLKVGELPKEEDTELYWSSSEAFHEIEWRTTDADLEGFEAAVKKVDTAFTKAKDAIMILEVEQGLSALQEFESATFH